MAHALYGTRATEETQKIDQPLDDNLASRRPKTYQEKKVT